MTTWAELRADIRADLEDTATPPKWSDSLLFLFTKDAIRDYSQYFPRRLDRVPLALAGGAYTLPDDFVEDIAVESPRDTFLEKRHERPGMRFRTQPKPLYYYIEGGKLYVNASPLDELLLTYFATHPIPTSEINDAFVLTIPDRDIELIRLYVKAKVNEQIREKTSRLDRYKQGSGRRDDNPITPEVANLMDEYYRKVNERMGGGAIRLYRVGRMA